MQTNRFLLYGANGYTGELIARFSHQWGLSPVLAGRNAPAIEELAKRLQLDYRIGGLDDPAQLSQLVKEFSLVVHAAGPYDLTAPPMIAACMEAGAHYIDLNGDLGVFELLQQYNKRAQENNLMVLPGAGFDVVPTDCLSLFLKKRLPAAVRLELAFAVKGSRLSRGTAITTLQKLGLPGARREAGKIVEEPVGKNGMQVDFVPFKERAFVMSIPWGDVSTAYFTTGIPNIDTYTGVSKGTWLFLKGQKAYNWLLRSAWMHKLITSIIKSQSPGPGDAQRDKSVSLIRGRVWDATGKSATAYLKCPEAYSLTAHTVLLIAKKILSGQFKPGYQTPATAFGEDLIMEIGGVERVY